MAKVPPDLFDAPLRGVALKGVGYTRTWRGKRVWSSWPRPQPYPRTITEDDVRRLFAEANHATAFMEASTQLFARDVARATTLNVRDLLVKALYNRLAYLAGPDGRVIYSMSSMIDVSGLLDVLGSQPGAILARGDDYWTVLPPGAAGDVLTVDTEGNPYWAPGGGGEGAGAFWGWPISLAPTIDSSSGWATKATSIRPDADLHVDALLAIWTAIAGGGTYEMAIAEWSAGPGSAVGAILARSSPLTGLANGQHASVFALTDPVNLAAGTDYCLALSRTDSTGTTAVVPKISQSSGDVIASAGPIRVIGGSWTFGTTRLTAAASPTASGTAPYFFGASGALGLV